jgi:hypothetical protein
MSDQTNLSVDRNRLGEDLETLPQDILVWNRAASEDATAALVAENYLKLVEANLSIDIRQNPVNYGITKSTEDTIKSKILIQPNYIEAQAAVVAAKAKLSESRAVCDALDAKRSSLKYLTELSIAGFLGSTNIQPKGVKN